MSETDQRRDPSLSLLSRISQDAMDPGYREAAVHAAGSSPARKARPYKFVLAGALVLLGLLLASSIAQIREGAPDAARTRAALTERVIVATAATNELAAQVDNLAGEVSDLREQALQGSAADRTLNDQVTRTAALVGLAPVEGPGVEVTLDDGPPRSGSSGEPDLARVFDQDVQLVVNGLFAAGAEAVAINGQRLTARTAIRGAGDAILVGYRPLTPPYSIQAIGDPASLESSFTQGQATARLQELADVYGITFTVTGSDSLSLPAEDQRPLRFAQPEESP